MKNLLYTFIILLLVPLLAYAGDSAEANETESHSIIYVMDISEEIGTVTADRVIDAIETAEEARADLLVITMDTPGGLVGPMWDITKAIMNSEIPVVVLVSPIGARAGSAGVFITYSAHIAAMAPSTNIGAAHVVSPGQSDTTMIEKMQNDAVASIRSMAEHYGRNADWAEEAVRESASITGTEALELNVIDLIAEDVDDLLEQINGREVKMAHGVQVVHTDNPVKYPIKKTFLETVLSILSSPNLIFLLFSLGGLGIAMEIYNPGSIFPGVFGSICLILAFYGTRFLPINYAGVAFILLAVLLFVLEIKIVSHGILTVGGVVSIIIGGMMLIDTVDQELKVSKSLIFSAAICIGAFVVFAFYYAYRARISQPATGREGLIGKTGTVKSKIERSGYVYVSGELWEASADEPIEEGEEIEVVEFTNLKMKVKKISK